VGFGKVTGIVVADSSCLTVCVTVLRGMRKRMRNCSRYVSLEMKSTYTLTGGLASL